MTLLATLALLLLLALAAAFASLLRGARANPEPACGKCGYVVRGLPTFHCPECGSDLRAVGIVSATPRGPLGLIAAVVASSWKRLALHTLLVAALTPAAFFAAHAFVLHHNVFQSSQAVLEPASKAFRADVATTSAVRGVNGRLNAQTDTRPAQALVLSLGGPGQVPDPHTQLRVELLPWTYTVHHFNVGVAPTTRPRNFDRDALLRFFADHGIDTAPPQVRSDVDALMHLMDACRKAPVHRAVATAKPAGLAVLSAADTSHVDLNTTATAMGGVAGPFLLGGAAAWLFGTLAILLARLHRLRAASLPIQGFDPINTATAPPAPSPAGAAAATARTLTVLFSDIKDYTARSTAAPRQGVLDLVRRHRDLASPVIDRRGGRIVKTMGDAILATFDSATDAALAGLEIQSALAAHRATAPADEHFHLRIAVACGEVIIEANDVYGDTVNLAARLQSVARPGNVLLSAATAALVNTREVRTEPSGSFQLAGFALPVQAHVAHPAPALTPGS
jgi:class 3 adenylate cyclase